MKNRLLKFGLPLFALLTGLLAVRATGLMHQPEPDERQFSQQVNLAMRQAADRLFDLAGDSTRTIPPVEMPSAGEFLLRLESDLSYDSLPAYLGEALAQNGIQAEYHVAVLDCLDGLLMLGYTKETIASGNVPCKGRVMEAGCYNLTVSFPGRATRTGSNAWAWWAVANLVAFAALSFFVVKKIRARKLAEPVPTATEPAVEAPAVEAPSGLLRFGNTAFDPANLYVQMGDARQPLTFREAKLLQFFAERPNRVLEREAIMAAVWEDEGIIVGRSLDVFVSRLRKILQNDPTVKLANVHGVGYRLEV
ncbi:MAG: helix-turn-helix domain-containing protein [Saprospiraceae bacterium]|jgi:hypothetical protein|nr:helix-turn-helix domain-containing protein [Saprospiraceae bacterium]